MESGEIWAYRERPRSEDCPFERVEYLQSAPKGAKFLIRFVDDAGREEWVPRRRLIVPWSDREAWLESERKMAAVVEVSAHADGTPQYEAVCALLEEWGFIDGIEIGYSPAELCTVQIKDLDELSRKLEMSSGELRKEPLAFTEDDLFIAPWSLAVKIAQCVAKVNGEAAMEKVMAVEDELQLEAIRGHTFTHGGEESWIPPDAEHLKERRERRLMAMNIVRDWCGKEVIERLDELDALRDEVRRLGSLVEQAIVALRRCGQDAIASTMESDLGVPISRLARPRRKKKT